MDDAASKRPSVWKIAREALWEGGPGVCHFSITNACNARCAFCSFAYDHLPVESRRWVTLADAQEACDILRRHGIRILHFNGGEPTLHRDLTAMVAHAARIGMMPGLDTNGALLTQRRMPVSRRCASRSMLPPARSTIRIVAYRASANAFAAPP